MIHGYYEAVETQEDPHAIWDMAANLLEEQVAWKMPYYCFLPYEVLRVTDSHLRCLS